MVIYRYRASKNWMPKKEGKDGDIMGTFKDEGSKLMRISEKPLQAEGILVDDRLESEGYIRLYEHISGAIYLSTDLPGLNNIVPVAEIEISVSEDRRLRVKSFFCEYGYEELLHKLKEQVWHFAGHHGYSMELLDLRKRTEAKAMHEYGKGREALLVWGHRYNT